MKFFKVLISIVLVIATCVTMMMPASAARVTYYLSDLKMSEADNAEDAKKEWIAAALEEGIQINEPETSDSYSGQFKLRLPKTLHKTLAEDSKKEGVSMNQYCVYLLAKNSEKEHLALTNKHVAIS